MISLPHEQTDKDDDEIIYRHLKDYECSCQGITMEGKSGGRTPRGGRGREEWRGKKVATEPRGLFTPSLPALSYRPLQLLIGLLSDSR